MTAPRTARRIENARARVAEAAWELLAERRWGEVTVAAICERADVAPRTFHRYFPDKAELLFSDAADHEEHLADSLARHPCDPESPRAYLVATLDDMADHVAAYGAEALATRQCVIASSPDLQARDLVKRERLRQIAVTALTERLTDPLRARMLATVALEACMAGMAAWAADGGELRTHVHRALAAADLD